MNTHRVTLTAFGTTGVLLAASLTMLAIVSALVTFDAWPTRDPYASPAEIAIQNPRSAKIVRTDTRSGASTGSRGGTVDGGRLGSVRGDGAPLLGATGRDPGATRDGGGGGDPGNPSVDTNPGDPAPTPRVGNLPPGEGDPGDGDMTGNGGNLVTEVTSTACGAVSGVADVGACRVEPEAYDYSYDPAPVEIDGPADVVDVTVDLPALP